MGAQIDYEAEDDPYVPCRELGISFHTQRVAMKQSIADEVNLDSRHSGRNNNKTKGFLCARRSNKRKKKEVPYSTHYYEDFDVEDTIVFEEVALYYPRPNRKRPIVLIGPPNIGRHELRQRLMADNGRFSA